MIPSLIVHGGAWDIPDDAVDACESGCHRALEAGWSILHSGGHALDAIEAAITVLEDDPVFDAGYGSHLNLDGFVECDAIVMDAATLKAGESARYAPRTSRHLYLVPATGKVEVNGVNVNARDGLAIRNEAELKITALEDSELVLVDAA